MITCERFLAHMGYALMAAQEPRAVTLGLQKLRIFAFGPEWPVENVLNRLPPGLPSSVTFHPDAPSLLSRREPFLICVLRVPLSQHFSTRGFFS